MNQVVTYGVSDVERMARAFAASKLFGVQTMEQALALCLIAQAEGRHPASAAADYHIVSGRPAKKAEAMLRDFIASGGAVKWHALDDTQADATFTHPQGGEVRITWDMERKKAAGINNPMWSKYPRQMLRSRCVSEGVRTVCPAATSGMYVPEEAQDIAEPVKLRDVTPEKPAEAPPRVSARHAPAQRALAAQREENGHSDDLDDLPPEPPRYDLADLQVELEEATTAGEVREVADRLKVIKSTSPGSDYEALRQAVQRKGSDLRALETEAA